MRLTETLTAVFDTLNPRSVLKELQLSRTTSGKVAHTERQEERQTTVHAESKEKPAQNPIGWRIASGMIAALMTIAGWKVSKKFLRIRK